MKSVYQLLFLQCLVLLVTSNLSLASNPPRQHRLEPPRQHRLESNPPNENNFPTTIEKRSVAEAKNGKQCGQYELYKTCNPGCERTCDDLNNDDHSGDRCTGQKLACIDGCICKSGYVREREDGNCIRVQECPRVKH